VALVTDGRMSGASGKVPAAIHITPEALAGRGPLGKVRDGDIIRLDALEGTLDALVPAEEWARRQPATADLSGSHIGMGRELFAVFRSTVSSAENRRHHLRAADADAAADVADAGRAQGGRQARRAVQRRGRHPHPIHRFAIYESLIMTQTLLDIMHASSVIPVIAIDDPAHAVPLARALVAGGIRTLEVTLRTAHGLDAIRAIAEQVPEAILGVGTLTQAHEFALARDAGAVFGVSPGLTPALAAASRARACLCCRA
jgi:dihydroxyacid dehydratase/phosphogluconate dehydratase